MKKNWTGERLETFIYSRDTIEHLHRYAIAATYTKDKVVLDVASGEGYGSNLLSKNASKVYGVDIDAQAVSLASEKYKKSNLEFKQGSAALIPIESGSIDVVVSFETIEHHDKHDEMLSEIKRVLKPDGMLIISTPDKLIYSDKRNFKNEFHVKELYKDEFVALISKYFSKSQLLFQNFIGNSSVLMEEQHQRDFKVYTGNYSNTELLEVDPFYLVLIASDYDFKKQNVSLFEGSSVENYGIVSQIYNSNSYKIGHYLLTPIRVFRKIFKN